MVPPDLPASFDFESHRRINADEYQKLRPFYVTFSHTIYEILRQAIMDQEIKVASIQARAKSVESFSRKCAEHSEVNAQQPKYAKPLSQITDLAGGRVITFFLDTVGDVESLVEDQFQVLEKSDKGALLQAEDRFGYQSIHYLLKLKDTRTGLPEYRKFIDVIFEVQVRTILQHVWAEIEHDIQYKSVEAIPLPIRRRFMRVAASLELMDGEFQAIHDEDEGHRKKARRPHKRKALVRT